MNSVRARRPYWVLLALALFFATQVAAVSHWHDAATNALDSDCALCVFSSTAGAAIVSAAVSIASIVLCTFSFLYTASVFVSQHTRYYQSRAPPFIS